MMNILQSFIIPELEGKIYRLKLEDNSKLWSNYLEVFCERAVFRESFSGIINAIKSKNFDLYKQKHKEIVNLYNKESIFERRAELLKLIKNYTPNWAEAIRHRRGIHGKEKVPDNIELAWKWLQLDSQIKRIDSYDPNLIQSEIHKLTDVLIKNAQYLAYEKAWYTKVKNQTAEQIQAVEGWRQTMRQVGRGTGRMAPQLLRQARELMPSCQNAIPVWIMPLNRVVESFKPQNNKFDVVIIDEASQADILALSVLYLGKKVIIVGDDEQVSPNAVGLKVEEVNALIEQYLQGIPHKHLYNGKTSIYDLAKRSGFKPLMLTEHFRCLPEIISFSNQLSYNGKIRPLRDTSDVHIKPAVVEYRVPNAVQQNKINIKEAEHIASLIMACIERDEYKGKTFGVISLLGQEQAYAVDRILQACLEPAEYEKRKIQCGNPAQFQGDERDVVFLSLVYAPKEEGGPLRLLSEDGNNDLTRKRYNVAASRAKDQMWVVYSLNPEIDLKPDDIRLRLIKHVANSKNFEIETKLSSTESEFEKAVMQTLMNRGYQVKSQWLVGAYRIDLVVEDADKRIAIECDGEKWHTKDDLANDLKRQAILERLGWRFIRIRGSAFYRNSENTMQWVYEELTKHDIHPNYDMNSNLNSEEEIKNENDLLELIKCRAESIRSEWEKENLDKLESEQ
ncbi:MAG: AAA domain-containing protein [Peptococcia bacterium]